MTKKAMAIIAAVVLAAIGFGFGAGYQCGYAKYESRMISEGKAFRDALGTVEKNPNYRPR